MHYTSVHWRTSFISSSKIVLCFQVLANTCFYVIRMNGELAWKLFEPTVSVNWRKHFQNWFKRWFCLPKNIILCSYRDLIYGVKKLLCNQELPSNRYIIRYLVIVMDNVLIFFFKCNLTDHFHVFYKSRLQGHPIFRISIYMHFVIASQVLLVAITLK